METTKKRISGWLVAVIIIVLLVIWGVSIRNSLATKDQAVNNKWSIIGTQLQRRYDLIPNLVSSVKGLTKQEQAVFGDIAQARTQYAGARTPDEQARAATQVEGALGRLLVITENYPQLRSSEAFTALMTELEGSENRIQVARKDYNDAVLSFNTSVVRFPGSLIAGISGYKPHEYFAVADNATQTPKVNFE
jgi:LemA protein